MNRHLKDQIRKVTALLIAVMMAIGMAGCGGNGGGSSNEEAVADDGRTVIYYAASYVTAQVQSAYKEMVQTYNDTQGVIDGVYVQMRDSSGAISGLDSALRSNYQYDVLQLMDDEFKTLAMQGGNYFVALDSYLTEEAKASMSWDDIPENLINRFRMNTTPSENGKYLAGAGTDLLALPNGSDPQVLFYNKTILENCGINIVSIPEAELDAYNSANGASLQPHGYAEYKDAPYADAKSSRNEAGEFVYKVFNECIAMNWEELRCLARAFQQQYEYNYGYMSEWWFNYGFSVGGDCVGWDEAEGQYKLTLTDKQPGYLALTDITVNGSAYAKGEVLRYEDKPAFIVRSGDTADLYVGGEHVCEMDLSTNKDGNASNVADQTTNIAIRLYGNTGEDVELPFTIDTELDKVTVNCTSSEYGAVSTAQKTYYLGDTVVLTSSDSSSHYCIGMTVDGKPVELAGDGTYSFIAAKSSYTVAGEFAQRIFKDSAEWKGFKQNEGTLSIPNSDGDSGWIETYRTDYQNFDFKVTLRDQDNAADNYRAGVRIYFTNDANIAISVTNDKANDDATTVYELQTMGGTMYNWKDSGYDLTAAQVAAIQSEAGLEMRIVRVGDVVDVYIGGVHAYEYDLSSGNVADLDARILLRFYGNTGKTVEVPFTLEETVDLVNVNVSAGKNGTITTDQKNYLSGDTVNLTVAGNAGYAHDSLTVNGQSVMTDLYGKYSFVITKDTTVKATFAKSVFKSTVSGWLLENQHYGQIAVNYTNGNGHSNWGDFADAYNDVDITITAREYADSVKPDLTRSAIRFTFSNGKIITFSIAKNTVSGGGYKYSIQSLSGDSVVGSNYDFYVMNDAQIAKFKGDAGIEFRVIRKGTKAYVYLDGELVVNGFDLTRNSSGVTADMAANITIRRYDDPNILAVYDNFSVSTTLPKVTVNIPTLKNGTVTADQDSYLPGETVTLTVAGNAGYAHDSLTVNGQSVMTDLYGKYSFVITEDTAVNATFAPSVFKSTVSGWLLENQHYGQIAVSENTGNSTWGDLAGEYAYGDIDITLTTKEFESTNELARSLIRFMFDNNKTFSVSVAKNKIGGKYEYTIESIGSGNLEAAGYDYYTLNDAQIAKYTGEGIAFRVIRSGTKVYVYLDGVLVVNGYDLTKGGTTGITADTKMNVTIRQYDTPNVVAVFDNFSVKSAAPTVNIDIAATANGTITADKTTCKLGDTVTLTVAGDSGYYHTGLYVNGQKVDVNWEGTYSFVAVEESYEVSCGFAAAVFTGGDTRYWDLFNHQVGELCVKSHTSGHSGWIDYTGTTNDVTTVVKNYNVSSKDFTMTYMFKFSNGETFNIRLHNTDDANIYRIQSMSSTLFDAWKTRYTLSDAEKAKVTGDGIEFRVIVLNSTAYIYLDGVQVCEYAFTKDVSAETVTVTLRMDGNLNNDAYLTYKLANTTELP